MAADGMQNRRIRILIVVCLAIFSQGSYAEIVAVLADRVITADSDKAIRNGAVVVDGERIVSVGDRSSVPANARVINLGDATLMPGMIDAHAHPMSATGDYQAQHLQQSSAYKSLRAAAFLQQLLLAGWTGQRVAGRRRCLLRRRRPQADI